MIWPVILIVLGSPFIIFFKILRVLPPIHMGKLGVVYDQAGKARVVGITNY